MKKQEIDFDTISLISCVDTKANDEKNAYKTAHSSHTIGCSTKSMTKRLTKRKSSSSIMLFSPIPVLFTDMPLALQIACIQKPLVRRLLADFGAHRDPADGQLGGRTQLRVLLHGVYKGSTVAVCTLLWENESTGVALL